MPDGEVGGLWVRGDSRAIGYWQRLRRTRCSAFRGEWYVSGDMLRKNADGTFVYCGRADDMLKVSGKWLSPGELENCLLQHVSVPRGRRGRRHERRRPGQAVRLHRHRSPPRRALAEALKDFAKTRLEPYKYPREVVFVDVAAAHAPGQGGSERAGKTRQVRQVPQVPGLRRCGG